MVILDSIWIAIISIYYELDCLLWNDQPIGSSDAAMRLWLIQSKLSEECWNIDTITKYNKYRFVPIETMDVTVDNIKYLYQEGNLLNDQKSHSTQDKNQDEEKKKI